ncbi:MAG: hypothetical protein IJ858_00600 [Acidaminococcaceae bacterium]|nr:hypothetical protein [Acidaminococcaceae bacterium]
MLNEVVSARNVWAKRLGFALRRAVHRGKVAAATPSGALPDFHSGRVKTAHSRIVWLVYVAG